ncbi:MAG: hypothetical protein HOV81_33895 [Kofleriaceae bacterium]|nr:hypothetical protein [Kofleriaceae bacterium]
MLGELGRGVYDGVRGAAYLISHPRLWGWVLAPAIVIALVFALLIGGILGLLSAPIASIAAFMPGHWADNVLELAAGIILVVASYSLFISAAAVIAGPFNEMLSESIEEHETGQPSPKFSLLRFLADAAVGAVHAIRRVIVYLSVILALLLLGVVLPVVGAITATVLGGIATARFASYDAYDAVWSRHRLRYRDKMAYLKTHRWRTLGLGAVMAGIVLVPGLNLIALAIGATGATLRSIDEAKAQGARASARPPQSSRSTTS